MASGAEGKAWFELSERILQTGFLLVEEPDIEVTEKGVQEPRVMAVALLVRTLSNFRAVLSLTQSDMLVEARILVRCCFENLFWAGSLIAKGEKFIKEMRDAEARGQEMAESFAFRITKLDETTEEELKERLLQLNRKTTQPLFLTPKKVAYRGGLRDDYHTYSRLSADASHPSLTALGRYITAPQADRAGRIETAPEREGELEDTLYLACYATLGVCMLVNEMMGGACGDALNEISAEYKKMAEQITG